MRIILTGITGNLGFEIGNLLLLYGHSVVPIIRASGPEEAMERLCSFFDNAVFTDVICADLEKEEPSFHGGEVDCIIHCAGIVHFKKSGDSNQRMIKGVIKLAQQLNTPIFHTSTAYIHNPKIGIPHNQYSVDKYHAEKNLASSGISHAIFRPSILTGHSRTGSIIHFGGYYIVVRAFLGTLYKSKKKIRFPRLWGSTNIIPVDWVAGAIVDAVEKNKKDIFYITNPSPPTFDWLLGETLRYFEIEQKIELLDCSLEDYRKMDLTAEENNLLHLCQPFFPYWSVDYLFPDSLCSISDIDEAYIKRILSYFKQQL